MQVDSPSHAVKVRGREVVLFLLLFRSIDLEAQTIADFGKCSRLLLARILCTLFTVFRLETRPLPESDCTGTVTRKAGGVPGEALNIQ